MQLTNYTFFNPKIHLYSKPVKGLQGYGLSYRFAFNAKELDTEGLGGGGSTYDYGFRIYNTNLGKFLSVDPLTKSYPFYTPYQFAGNKPIWAIDLDGLEELLYSVKSQRENKGFDLAMKKMNYSGISKELKKQFSEDNKNIDVHIYVANLKEDAFSDIKAVTVGSVITNYENLSSAVDRLDLQSLDLSKIKESISKGKGVILIVLDKKNIDKDETGNKTAMSLTHEINAHAMDMKDGKNDVPQKEEHEKLFNEKRIDNTSPDYKDIKKDSPAGKYKSRIENINLSKPAKKK